MTQLPAPRGTLSASILDLLAGRPGAPRPAALPADARTDDDLQLALYLCYELHYGGLDGVPDALEWSPQVQSFRRSLESAFTTALRSHIDVRPPRDGRRMVDQLRDVVRQDPGPSLARYLETEATTAQFAEFLLHRSAYHLKEADPFTWLIPRVHGRTKAALVQIQADEYGGGDASWMHSSLFADTMRAFGLDPDEGPLLDLIPGSTLAVTNLLSLFCLHRTTRGEGVGALALFEMTSCIPNRRYGNGMRRLGFGRDATRFFDEHVEADAVHEAIAATDLAETLAREEGLWDEVLFGAHALQQTEALAAGALVDAWSADASSLLGRDAVASAPA